MLLPSRNNRAKFVVQLLAHAGQVSNIADNLEPLAHATEGRREILAAGQPVDVWAVFPAWGQVQVIPAAGFKRLKHLAGVLKPIPVHVRDSRAGETRAFYSIHSSRKAKYLREKASCLAVVTDTFLTAPA